MAVNGFFAWHISFFVYEKRAKNARFSWLVDWLEICSFK